MASTNLKLLETQRLVPVGADERTGQLAFAPVTVAPAPTAPPSPAAAPSRDGPLMVLAPGDANAAARF